MSLRHELFGETPRKRTRADDVARARRWHADRKAYYIAFSLGEGRPAAFKGLCAARRDLTRQLIFERVERQEPLAVFRYQWIYRALEFRRRLAAARQLHARHERCATEALEKVTRGTRADGRPYAKGTLTVFRKEIQDYERHLVEAAADLEAFFQTAPPRYHVWRRQEEEKREEEARRARPMSRATGDPDLADVRRRLDAIYTERYVDGGLWEGLAALLVKWTPQLPPTPPTPPPAPNVIILAERVRQRHAAAAAAREAARGEEA